MLEPGIEKRPGSGTRSNSAIVALHGAHGGLPRVPPRCGRGKPSRAELAAIAAIAAVALGLRVWNLVELHAHDPFFESPSVDEGMYHRWAWAIAQGNGFGDQVFLNGPAYPAFLALIYKFFGPNLLAAKAVQSALSAFDCVLVWALGRQLFGAPVALGAAGMDPRTSGLDQPSFSLSTSAGGSCSSSVPSSTSPMSGIYGFAFSISDLGVGNAPLLGVAGLIGSGASSGAS